MFGWVGDAVGWAGDQLFGDDEGPGALGTGQYQVEHREVNADAGNIQGAERMRQTYDNGAAGAGQRAAPTIKSHQATGATINTGAQDQARAGQTDLVRTLAAQANGTGGPSVAENQLARGAETNMANALAMASSVRGGGGAGTLRQVADQRSQIGAQASADAATLRAGEQQQAQGMLASTLQGMRGQDVELATQQAGLTQQTDLANAGFRQQTGLANQSAQLATTAQNDATVQNYLNLGLTLAQAQAQADLDRERMRVQTHLTEQGIQSGAYAGAAGTRAGLVGDIANGIGSMLGVGA